MEITLRSIGDLARSSGLTVSALRFYDGAGVLTPAFVDPCSGYRWYDDDQLADARLVAGLRRVGMPLADISRVLAARSDTVAVRALLDAHLQRLEAGLADARRELSAVRSMLDPEETPVSSTRITCFSSALAAALGAVRFAARADHEIPVLGGVLLDVAAGAVRLVATDRYRLAVAAVEPAETSGPDISVALPLAAVDELRPLLDGEGPVTLTVDGARVVARAGSQRVECEGLEGTFPDYRRLTRVGGRHLLPVAAAELRDRIADVPAMTVRREADGADVEVVVLTVDEVGELGVGVGVGDLAGGGLRVGLDREFLLQAVAAAGCDQLLLELDGPISPLAVRPVGSEETFSILMPVRLD